MLYFALLLIFLFTNVAETWPCSENGCIQSSFCKSPKPHLDYGWLVAGSSRGPYESGSSITYRCNRGYLPAGDTHRVCLNNATWSGGPIACTAVDCGIPNIINETHYSLLQGTTTYPSTLVVRCHGSNRWSACSLQGHWKPGNQCINLDEKSDPEATGTCNVLPELPEKVPLITRDKGPYYTGRVIQYGCRFGYAYLKGSTLYNCTKGGVWIPPRVNITCSRITCEIPLEQFENGLMNHQNRSLFYVSDTISYKCNRGYQNIGSWFRRCQTDRSWSGQPAACKEVQCKSPQLKIKHGRAEPLRDTYYYGDRLAYTCDKGYIRMGPGRRGCKEDGTWSGKDIWCKAHKGMSIGSGLWNADGTCGAPPVPEDLYSFTSADSGPYYSGSTVHYKCADGYHYMGGTTTHKCTRTGDWSPDEADIICKGPDHLLQESTSPLSAGAMTRDTNAMCVMWLLYSYLLIQ